MIIERRPRLDTPKPTGQAIWVRKITTGALILSSTLATMLPGLAWADGMRCGNRLVGEGDTALELKAKCGRPDHVESLSVLRADGFERYDAVSASEASTSLVAQRRVRYVREEVQHWLYGGDVGALGRLVTVRRGKVESIESLGKLDLTADPKCVEHPPAKGTRVGVVELSCGAPDDRARWEETREAAVNGVLQSALVTHEKWTYNPGPTRLIRVLHFENGRLTRIETGGHGL